ncbi:MAG: DUF4907 domain-containing protein [Bacteroidota bacterium]
MKQLLILFSVVLISCESQTDNPVSEKQTPKRETTIGKAIENPDLSEKPSVKQPASNYTYVTIYSDSIGWGYDILEGSVRRIHQPHIPAVQGNQGFKSGSDAAKVAEKVIEKLNKGIMPPTVSVDEMRDLGVL